MLAGGSSALSGYDSLVSKIFKDLKDKFDLEDKISLKGVSSVPEPKRCVSRGAYIYQNQRNVNLDMSRPISPHRVLWPLPLGANPTNVRTTTINFYNSHDIGSTSSSDRYAIIIDRNTPVPTPDAEKKIISLREDLGINSSSQPFKLFTQIGSATPLTYRFQPIDDIPEMIEPDTKFCVFLDKNNKIMVEFYD